MEYIPLIRIKKREILEQNKKTKQDFFNLIQEEDLLYILDLDGLQKDKPNLCTFQKLSNKYRLWVDNGPRDLGDVVDSLMTGVDSITIRNNLFPQLNLSSIREITENKIYANINKNITKTENMVFDGFVNLNEKNKIEEDYEYINLLNTLKMNNKIICYENNPLNISYWHNLGIETLLVDIDKISEFKKYELRK